jgi:hypothetical protein
MKNLIAKIKEKFSAMPVEKRTKIIIIGMVLFVTFILIVRC